MNESILTSVKKLLGITEEYNHFDADIIMHINTVFMVLMQLGVGPANGFSISDASSTWGDFLQSSKQLEAVRSYVYLRVKMMFDPPQAGAVIQSTERLISELEFRLNVEVDPGESS